MAQTSPPKQPAVASAPAQSVPTSIPQTLIDRDTLLPSDQSPLRFGERGLRLPVGGGSIRLRGSDGFVWLDLWEGDREGFDLYQSRALTIAACMLELELSRRQAA